MSQAPFHTRTQFEKAVERLIEQAVAQNRGDDLDRLVGHLQSSPPDVSRLASLLMMIDEDYRPQLKADVEAYRRFVKQKGRDATDEEIVQVLVGVYNAARRGAST